MAISTNRAMHVTAPVTVGTAAQLVTATDPLGPNDAGRLFYDTTEAIAGGIGWKVWNGGALVTDYTYVTQATLLSGEDQANDVLVVENGRFHPQQIAKSAASTVLGGTGAAGDYLDSITFPLTTAGGVCTITDGTYTVSFEVGTLAATYMLNWTSTAAGFTVDNSAQSASSIICCGRFTA